MSVLQTVGTQRDYLRDPVAIYRASFAAIRREAGLERLPSDLQSLALRLVHACGMPDIVDDLAHTTGAVRAGRRALAAGAPVICDVTMVAAGVNREHLPVANPIHCAVQQPDAARHASSHQTTRSAAGMDLLRELLPGAVVAIGNAPTALFRLLELLADGMEPPALVLAFPVGFIGAAESKDALIEAAPPCAYVTLRGRRGGSALAAAALNALLENEA